jgi:hypothetical protein
LIRFLRTKATVMIYRLGLGVEKADTPFLHTANGREVFAWLLERTGVFRRVETEEQRTLHNFGIELLENAGMTQGPNYRRLAEELVRYPVPEEALDTEGMVNGRR